MTDRSKGLAAGGFCLVGRCTLTWFLYHSNHRPERFYHAYSYGDFDHLRIHKQLDRPDLQQPMLVRGDPIYDVLDWLP